MRLDMTYREGPVSKAQRKAMSVLEAWFTNQPIRQPKEKTVPQLTTIQVIDMYIPPAAKSFGQYMTPLDMVGQVHRLMKQYEFPISGNVLEPCAGIGNLLQGLPANNVTAYELNHECVLFGERLLPSARWIEADVFECLPAIEGQFDVVVMNPPYGSTAGMATAQEKSQISPPPKTSEYLFLELAVRAPRPGGMGFVIASPLLKQKMTKAFAGWFDSQADLINTGPLSGEFKLTKVRVSGYVLKKKEDTNPVVAPPTTRRLARDTGQQMSLF